MLYNLRIFELSRGFPPLKVMDSKSSDEPPGSEQLPVSTEAAAPVATSAEPVPLTELPTVDIPAGYHEPNFPVEVSFAPGI